nr:hypothetical protein GCM10020092_061400 [Actinoplanes digitatis]
MFPVVNILGMVAAEAAYTHGEPWLEALLRYLRDNHAHFADRINGATSRVRVLPSRLALPRLDGLPRPRHGRRVPR